MTEIQNPKRYDLEERALVFARRVRVIVKTLAKSIPNQEDSRQLVRASGSVGANYIEANEALSRKDFMRQIKICRKEAKESRFWLERIDTEEYPEQEAVRKGLLQEASELVSIFGSILCKAESFRTFEF